MKAILIIGNCGVGKTYVMQKAIQQYKCNDLAKLGLINAKEFDRSKYLRNLINLVSEF